MPDGLYLWLFGRAKMEGRLYDRYLRTRADVVHAMDRREAAANAYYTFRGIR